MNSHLERQKKLDSVKAIFSEKRKKLDAAYNRSIIELENDEEALLKTLTRAYNDLIIKEDKCDCCDHTKEAYNTSFINEDKSDCCDHTCDSPYIDDLENLHVRIDPDRPNDIIDYNIPPDDLFK